MTRETSLGKREQLCDERYWRYETRESASRGSEKRKGEKHDEIREKR